MSETPESNEYIAVNRARGRMLSPSAAEIVMRHFSPIVSDEPATRGEEDRGPSPLEYLLAALCA